jgi:hypothetical protein
MVTLQRLWDKYGRLLRESQTTPAVIDRTIVLLRIRAHQGSLFERVPEWGKIPSSVADGTAPVVLQPESDTNIAMAMSATVTIFKVNTGAA